VTAHEKDVVALLRQIGDCAPDDATIRIVDCGLHSGFPACCVAFFAKVWWPLHVAQRSSHARRKTRKQAAALIDNYHRALGQLRADRPHLEYVPCPRCLRSGDFVSMRPCGRHLSKRQCDQVRKILAA